MKVSYKKMRVLICLGIFGNNKLNVLPGVFKFQALRCILVPKSRN